MQELYFQQDMVFRNILKLGAVQNLDYLLAIYSEEGLQDKTVRIDIKKVKDDENDKYPLLMNYKKFIQNQKKTKTERIQSFI